MLKRTTGPLRGPVPPVTVLLAIVSCLLAPLATSAAVGTDPLEQVRAAEQDRIAVMAEVTPSVVCIFKSDRSGGGAGVVITEDGYGLTNYHVVAPLLKTRRGLGGMSDGQLYPLQVLGIDPTGDVAMFRLTGKDRFIPARLGNSDNVRLGDWVFAMGNPFGLSEDYTPGVTHGIVSGLHRYQFGSGPAKLVYTDCIQVDASINPGNSGGPLFDMSGQVIGINGRASFEFEQRGRVNVGVGFAISINQIKRFIPLLRAGLLAKHGSLGATMVDLGYRHVAIEKMLDPSAAAAAGLRIGDRLRRFAGHEIHSSNQFANILGTFPADWPVSVEFERNGQRFHRNLRLDPLPVHLKKSFEPDQTINQAEAERVLDPAQKSPGVPVPDLKSNGFTAAIRRATSCTVKIYGAKIGQQKGFGTGIVVSQDGFVVTVASLMLETENLRAVTPDGHVYPAEVVYRDTYRQLALLKLARHPDNLDTEASVSKQMAAMHLSHFKLSEKNRLKVGDWILAAGNPFKIADGDERVSVMKGIVSGWTQLNALQGTQPFPYRGRVLLIDAITATPGSPGSALVDLDGRCVGLVGEIVTSRLTNTSLNYAYPVEEIVAFIADARAKKTPTTQPTNEVLQPGYHGIKLSKIAYRRQLPFVQSLAKGSPSEAAGVRRDDLIVSANGVSIPRARAFRELCERLHAGDELSLMIKRDDKLIPIRFTLTEPPQ